MPVLLPLRDFKYAQFSKLIEDENATYLRQQIDEFVESFCKACSDETMLRQSQSLFPALEGSDAPSIATSNDALTVVETFELRQKRRGNEYLKIMESFALVLLKDPFWALLSSDGKVELDHDSDEMALYFELIFSFLEIYIVPRIHRCLFVPDKKSDWDVAVKCLEFEYIRPTHLDLNFLPDDLSILVDTANSVFTEMAFEPIPSLKANHLGTVWKLIEVFLIASKEAVTSTNASQPQTLPSMDDIFPVLVYLIIKTHPPQLLSDLAYLSVTCRDMKTFGSFTSFYVANTQIALEFIKNLSQEKLSTPNDENLSPSLHSTRIREALSKSVPTAYGSHSEATSSQAATVENRVRFAAFSRLVNVKERISKTVEMVADHVTGSSTFASYLSPLSTVAAAIRSPSKKLSPPSASQTNDTSSETQKVSENGVGEILAEPNEEEVEMKKKYRFFNTSPSDLSPEDVAALIAEYNILAKFNYEKTR